jgi:hypothetical protein
MQLVELESQGGNKVWVNPAQVVCLSPTKGGDLSSTCVYLVGWQQPNTVKGTLAEVARKINEALKA